uniref:Lipoma-preferred partner homolog n=1 Tax=Parastrongyloides trichosuri TaxID=131310 RepID=A0A0N4Z9M3_PARTI
MANFDSHRPENRFWQRALVSTTLPRNSNTATSKYEEKFLQKPKTDDFYLTSNDNFLNKLNTSILSKSQQYKSNSISPTFNSNINQIPLSATNTTVTTDPLTKKQTTTTTYKYYSDGSGNVQNFKNNTYNFDKPYSNITTPSFENQQSLLNFKDNDTIIKDPKALIHEFATKTSISDIIEPCELENQLYKIPITNRNQREKSFAETLRDSSLTQSQKHSNKFQKSLLQDTPLPKSFNTFYQTNLSTKGTDELNDLIRDMQLKLSSSIDRNIVPENNKTSYSKTIGSDSSNFSATQYTTTYNTILNSRRTMSDNQTIEESKLQRNNYICNKCNQIIQPDRPGVTALGNFYHVECFVCEGCGKQLAGSSFYNVQGKCYCEVDYVNSLEKCLKCRLPIKQKILRALGGAYHPECFVCHNCEKSLDGVGFTTNKDNEPHCMHCFHEKYSPRCATCLKPIAPAHNETEVPRIIAMDKSYHVECYRCEDCGLQLNSKIEGQGCYPIESRLFCKACNQKRLS